MNITTEVHTDAKRGTVLVSVVSSIALHEDTIWAIAAQAVAADKGLRVERLSRSYEAYDFTTGENNSYTARFEAL